jgi:hypothetical protein
MLADAGSHPVTARYTLDRATARRRPSGRTPDGIHPLSWYPVESDLVVGLTQSVKDSLAPLVNVFRPPYGSRRHARFDLHRPADRDSGAGPHPTYRMTGPQVAGELTSRLRTVNAGLPVP